MRDTHTTIQSGVEKSRRTWKPARQHKTYTLTTISRTHEWKIYIYIYLYIYMYIYIYTYIYNNHCCFLETNQDVTCRGNCTRLSTEREKSMDRGSDTASRCRRPLPFPLTCQHRRNMSRRVKVYGSRQRRSSMTQTTTTVSASMPARMKKSMDRGSDAAPQCRRRKVYQS